MMRFATGLGDLIGQCLRLSPEGGLLRLHPGPLLVWGDLHHATVQNIPGEIVEWRAFLPRAGWSGRGFGLPREDSPRRFVVRRGDPNAATVELEDRGVMHEAG